MNDSYGYGQLTRGAGNHEIAISIFWYTLDDVNYHAFFISHDNGINIDLMYYSHSPPLPGEVPLSKIKGDAQGGTYYNYRPHEFWITNDYGYSWQLVETGFPLNYLTSGLVPGEVYRQVSVTKSTVLERSIDFGANFFNVNTNIAHPEVGINPGEIYYYTVPYYLYWYTDLYFSSDSGNTFSLINSIDTTIAGTWSGGPQVTGVHRGHSTGELYIVGWHHPSYFTIYYSSDTGMTFSHRYTSPYIDLFFYNVGFTGGNDNGDFYVLRSKLDPTFTHTILEIDYSSDTAKTFTTYYHDLDPTTFGVVDKTIAVNEKYFSSFYNRNERKIHLHFSDKSKGNTLLLIDIFGNIIQRHNNCTNFLSLSFFDGTPGIYFLSLITENGINLQTEKIILN